MSFVHTRNDPMELLLWLTPPRNPERRKRLLAEAERREAPKVVAPKVKKPPSPQDELMKFLRWCRATGFEPIVVPFWPAGKRIKGKVLNFTYGLDEDFEHPKQTLCKIMKEVAKKHGVSVNDIKSAARHRAIIPARQEYFYRARTETVHSYPSIARYCGNRDHTTALYAVKQHALRCGVSMPGERSKPESEVV